MRKFTVPFFFVFCLCVFLAPQTVAWSRDGIVQVVVPAPAGGQPDALMRQIADRLEKKTGSRFLIFNKPGASGTIGSAFVAEALPDGKTVLFTPKSYITSTAHLMPRQMPFDPLNDLIPVVQTGTYGFVLVSHPSVQAKTLKELIALAKTKPDMLSFGSPGVGNSMHIAGELFQQMAKVKMLHAPFVGAPPALNALLGGHIDLAFSSVLAAKPFIDAGKLHGIAVTGLSRDPLFPDIPTISESGLSGYEMTDWNGIFVPKGTPQSVVEYYNTLIHDVLTTEEMRDLWKSQGIKFVPNTPAQFKAIVLDGYNHSGELIRSIGITPQ